MVSYSDRSTIATASQTILPSPKPRNGKPQVIATYHYADESGILLFQVLRYEPKDFRQRAPDGVGGWRYSLEGVRRVLFRLPEILTKPDEVVWITEGEKDCERLADLDFCATTAAAGANAPWLPEYSESLRGRDVIVLPHADEPGRKHAQKIEAALAGIAASVLILNLPGDNPKGFDVSDWLNADPSRGRRELLDLAVGLARQKVDDTAPKTSEPEQPEPEECSEEGPSLEGPSEPNHKPILICLADVESKPVEWLWQGRIGLGKMTSISGNPGDGKSILTCDIAARTSRGMAWPDGSGIAPCGSVILMNAEDDLEDTIRPRLDAAGADVRKIHALQGIAFKGHDGRTMERAISIADIDIIKATAQQLDDLKLIILDPVTCFLGDADSHKNAEVRTALAPLVKLAAERGFAIINVTHLNKGNGQAMYRSMGSLAFVAAARAAFVVAKDKNDQSGERRLFLPIKNNIGNDKTGLAYSIVSDAGCRPHLSWEEGTISTTADEALSVGTESAEGTSKDRRRDRTEAGWTDEVLRVIDTLVVGSTDGTLKYADVKEEAGLNSNRMVRACFLLKDAGIIAVETAECVMPNGGTKDCKTIRRLCGGSYKPSNLRQGF